MLIIFRILLIYATFAKSPPIFDNIPLRTDCYVSFSNPVIHMDVSHYYPTGPYYLYTTFYYNRYSISKNNNTHSEYAEYNFKKVGKKCENSLIFTTLGNNFKKLDIIITLHLVKNANSISVIEYTFNKGFTPGIHGLQDHYQHFIVYIKVINEINNYLGVAKSLETYDESDINSITTQNGELCVITYNNPSVFLRPYFGTDVPSGLIIGLQITIFRNATYFDKLYYPAYSCDKYISYPEITAVFITCGQNIILKFSVISIKYFNGSPKTIIKKINIDNPKFDVHYFQGIPKEYTKLFLIKRNVYIKECKNGLSPLIYFSEDKTIYYAELRKLIKSMPSVEYFVKLYRSLEDPCTE